MSSTANFFSRYWRIMLFIIALILMLWLVWTLLSILLPFILGLILAYLLLPVIRWLESKFPGKNRWSQTKRILLILLVYLLFFGGIGLILFYTLPFIVNSVNQFISNLPKLIPQLTKSFEDFLNAIRQQVPPEIQTQINSYLANIGNSISGAIGSGFTTAISYLSSTFGFALGFISLPVFLFFVLKDAERLNSGFYSAFSPWLREHVRGVVQILTDILGRYIRASIVLGLVVGSLDFIGLMVLGIPYAVALALWAGLTELIPVLGPWIGGIPGVIVALATTGLSKTAWVIVVYAAVQILEGNILVPRIHSQYLRLHPAIILILLVIGAHFGGIWGIILVVPLTAVFVQLYKFISHSIMEEGLKRK